MKIALIFPPACDPTAPYLSVPALTGFLRSHGLTVLPIDANLEGFSSQLRAERLSQLADRIEQRLAYLSRRPSLDHQAQLEYLTLGRMAEEARVVPSGIAPALSILRQSASFFDPRQYADAVVTVETALQVISLAHSPLEVNFTCYRTPFALTTPEEMARDAQPEYDPFHDYIVKDLIPRLVDEKVDVIGVSICFPGQLVPAYSFARKLKQALPGVHLVAGGPAITQIMLRVKGSALRQALGAFDSAVVFEGEHTLLSLCQALSHGRTRPQELAEIPNLVLPDGEWDARLLPGPPTVLLHTLPMPDFAGLPLRDYLSPQLLLPYDPTRGCYWGRCAFCHYGLTAKGTARYRERAIETMVAHLGALSVRHGTKFFYFSHDSVAPQTLGRLADALTASGLDLRWGTDLRPEAQLKPALCTRLRQGGAVACSLGVESAHPRVLGFMDKGLTPEVAKQAIRNLAEAGIAAEVMCFTGFPSETFAEAMTTLRLLHAYHPFIAAFIVGQFDLTSGSRVAEDPKHFGLAECWNVEGDTLLTALFFKERKASKRDHEQLRLEEALNELASGWLLRHYPWAGSLSTAHTLFYYNQFGNGVFRALAKQPPGRLLGERPASRRAPLKVRSYASAEEHEAQIWYELTQVQRKISRQSYAALAAKVPRKRPSHRR